MRSYGKNKETGGLRYDPIAESSLEERMMKLRLSKEDVYPERSGEEVCRYYMKTGVCGFGASCRFNHPRQDADVIQNGGEEHPERIGQPFTIWRQRAVNTVLLASMTILSMLRFLLIPWDILFARYNLKSFFPSLMLGEKECSYFVKTGHCKFGANCKFDHPLYVHNHVPTARLAARDVSAPLPTLQSLMPPSPLLASQPYEMFPRNWHLRTPRFLPSPYPYLHGAYRPTVLHPGNFPMPSWSPYPIHMSPVVSPGIQPAVASGLQCQMSHLSATPSPYAGALPFIPSFVGAISSYLKEPLLAERPGHP